jgi:hypothetical protein
MISRAHMRRQLRAKGGITDVVQRTNYLFGGIKDRIRKLIPNEIADVAVKAAPFVAPFNPAAGALMRGIGRFDQRGSISDALKQGVATFGFGKGVGILGGAQSDPGLLGRQRFSKEGFQEGPIGRLFDRQAVQTTKDAGSNIAEQMSEVSIPTDNKIIGTTKSLLKKLPKGVAAQLAAGGITAGASLLASYFQGDFREQEPGETMEEYLAARKVAVGKQMRTYMDNYYASDPEYSALDDAGRDMFVARYNVKDGGRIQYQTGGISSANTLAQNIARNRAAQQQFSEFIAPAQQATRAAILAATPKSLTGPTTKLYSGTTSATPFGGSKFFATPDLATAKTYATSNPITRGSPFAGPVTGKILQAEVPTSQAQNLLKKGFSGTREVVLDPQAAKTLFETGQGALKGSSSLATRAAVAGTKALPVVGGALTLEDAASRLNQGDYVGAGLGAAAAIPGIGLPALGAQVVYDVAKNNPTIQKIGTSIGEGIYDLFNPSTAMATEADKERQAEIEALDFENNPQNYQSNPDESGYKSLLSRLGQKDIDILVPGESFEDSQARQKQQAMNTRQKINQEFQDYLDKQGYQKYLSDREIYQSAPAIMERENKLKEELNRLAALDTDVAEDFGFANILNDPNYRKEMTGYTVDRERGQTPVYRNLSPEALQEKLSSSLENVFNQYGVFNNQFRKDPLTSGQYSTLRNQLEDLKKYGNVDPKYSERIDYIMPESFSNIEDIRRRLDPNRARFNTRDPSKRFDYGDVEFKQGSGLTLPSEFYKDILDRSQGLPSQFQGYGKNLLKQLQAMKSGGRVGLMGGAMPTGIMRSNQAGVMERDYRDKGGFVPVGIKEKADDVPAMLSKNEFVMTANAVRGAGNGSIEKGAQKMYDTMKNLERRVV